VRTKSINIFDIKFVLERDKCIQRNYPDESVVMCPWRGLCLYTAGRLRTAC